ncbi:methyl-accepting chemotaxis protein [Caldanaerobacter subterraneus subsp. tengcongensis MB4]|uniref:HAMP domain protein n=1 Tax=Caldanaerobacter subterraneus subsp. tengcongensis (strain DSM 15242 / JCM 11007 / NBRC 100824 / MB4) TaxID=273068 RepID=Q8RAX9_CALS4|nr:methyl-accepting chemotaxis protein [Caldanaerobacter subterraneus]AAM24306.1 HAMP domain protein [Caldanaerobacter subterraneus subsp. tengcongensis MB4]MCS3916162.1 methyl-accepting chemotaxis protein [Caldanaerobacter subterraneus subsp. tengcongensis MB4]
MLLEKLKSNTTINAQEIAKLVELTSNTQNNIEALVKLNAETAANVVDKANLAYSKSKVIFLVVSILLTAISVITALAITRLLRNSIKQVNILAERLSKYDFTAETDDEGKNEFTEMNRSLKTVIENIKEAIRTVKKM